jgi:AraC-like DNA-binding protein/predicted enzyme related to lactoylglutathione lyase
MKDKNNGVNERHHELRQVLRYIRDHQAEAMTLASLAASAHTSPFHFTRLFRQQTGRGVGEHLRLFRLTRAAVQLRLTGRKIVGIALDAGYANHESFSRAFRHHFGLPPRRFRALAQQEFIAEEQDFMSMMRINLVKIPVSDFVRATHFYWETLGLNEQFAVAAYGWAQYELPGVPLCLYVPGMGGGQGQPGGEAGFHLEVSHIEQFRDGYLDRGGQIHSDIVASDDGGQFLILSDPDGNLLKVVQATG